jgi:hypothetical protein
MEKRHNPIKEEVMPKILDLIMITALAVVLGLGTACFGLFTDSNKPAKEAEIPECAGLGGQAKIDCEARHKKP